MKLLLDTNVFLWSAFNPLRMTRLAQLALEDPANELVVSVVTPLELGIAVSKGRLNLGQSVSEFYTARLRALGRTSELQVTLRHALAASELPYVHKDPMDRILAAQSIVEGIPLVTSDRVIATLGVDVIW